jgi:hypothetical protein
MLKLTGLKLAVNEDGGGAPTAAAATVLMLLPWPRSTYKYSAFTVMLLVTANSPPAPTVHPTIVFEESPVKQLALLLQR